MRIFLHAMFGDRYRSGDIEITASTCRRRLKSKIVCEISDSRPILTVGSKSGDNRDIRDSVEMLSREKRRPLTFCPTRQGHALVREQAKVEQCRVRISLHPARFVIAAQGDNAGHQYAENKLPGTAEVLRASRGIQVGGAGQANRARRMTPFKAKSIRTSFARS